jgi:hypothetical protein
MTETVRDGHMDFLCRDKDGLANPPLRRRQGIKRCHYDLLTCESTVRRLGAPPLSIRGIILAILCRGPLCREASI